jgi:hypothetical protein
MDKLFLAAIKEETIGLEYFNHVGVGKVNATYNTLKLINIHKPKIIINYGTAGAINSKVWTSNWERRLLIRLKKLLHQKMVTHVGQVIALLIKR